MNETNWWDKKPYVKQVRLGEFTITRDPESGEYFKSVPIYDIPAIIQAVREEERKETRVEFIASDEMYSEWYECKSCGSKDVFAKANFCPNCGLRIKWE